MSELYSIPYEEIMTKYQTGLYTVEELSKEYKVRKSLINNYIKKHNVKIISEAHKAISDFKRGFSEVSKIANSDSLQIVNPTLLVDEIFDIVKKHNPKFASDFNIIFKKIIKASSNILEGDVDSRDIKNITSAFRDMNDVLQVIPKPPAIAQQININKEQRKVNQEQKPFNVMLEIVECDDNKDK